MKIWMIVCAMATLAAFGDVTRFSQLRDAAESESVDLMGVVTHVFPDAAEGFVLASHAHYDMGGVRVLPPKDGEALDGAFGLDVGETVVVQGSVELDGRSRQIRGAKVLRSGRIEMAPPPVLRMGDFRKGWRHLRRHRLAGFVVSCADEPKAAGGRDSILWLEVTGTRAAVPIIIHGGLTGETAMPGALVEVEGIVVNTFDAEGNATSGRMDVSGAANVRLVSPTPVNWWRVTAIGAGTLLALALVAFAVYRLRIHRQRADERLLAADRRRIADDLHDNMQQLLAGAMFMLTSAENAVRGNGEAVRRVAAARKAVASSQAGLRSVLWGLQENAETPDSDAGLMRYAASRMPHWEGVVEIVSRGSEPAGVRRHGGRMLMILQEAVQNAMNHGGATRVIVRLVADAAGGFMMSVADNGCGFEIAESRGGMGIASMRRRAGEMGAAFSVASVPGKGTKVKVKVQNGSRNDS